MEKGKAKARETAAVEIVRPRSAPGRRGQKAEINKPKAAMMSKAINPLGSLLCAFAPLRERISVSLPMAVKEVPLVTSESNLLRLCRPTVRKGSAFPSHARLIRRVAAEP